ncbi:MAG TPA: D-alanyl-D-alanine carboxypeptidase/D-alanyl-D-alanine-endopeptidase [Gemmatimonadales bacterium]|nr:D-alanyl-D-alanine carboxypeptidase/D-alanyl-D-alanine-endopeptidase [Gemmatimonadales bacterium]
MNRRSGAGTQGRGAVVRAAGLVALTLCVAAPARLSAQSLQKRLDRRLAVAPWDRSLWGIAVIDDQGKLRYGRDQDRLFIPASNTKLLVTSVASALLPPDWTVKTSVYAAGPVTNGVVSGDLILYGRGDPTLGRSKRCYSVDTTLAGACDTDPYVELRQLADSLKARGITAVEGDLVGDGSYFEPETVNPWWEGYDLNWWYAAPVTGLAFNDNSVDIRWAPDTVHGGPALLSISPLVGALTLENRTRTRADSAPTTIDFFRTPGTLALWAEGDVNHASHGGLESFAMPDPNLFAARAFRQVLAEDGISVLGTTRSTTDSLEYRAARNAAPLAEAAGRPLKDWIFPILNTSQNWFAEMLLKQLGRTFGSAGSWHEGIAVERRFLIDSMGVDSTQFAVEDGSGLAAADLVSPLAFTRILRYTRSHRGWATFEPGLPLAGAPGSLKNRFHDTPLAGRVRAKTGSIGRVNTLSGFIEFPDGKVWTVSVMANHHAESGNAVIAEIDSLVVDIGRSRK